MIVLDESALICDLAETYGIYDYRSLPARRVATFSVGLRENSRIMMKISGEKIQLDTLLMAHAVDRLSLMVWMNSKDGVKGTNRPGSIVDILLGTERECDSDIVSFDSLEDFQKARYGMQEEEEWRHN